MRALSVRQPWAELIMRGIKTIEARSWRTHVCGRVLVYACLRDAHIDHQIRVRRQHKIQMEKLARGVLVGSVEIVGCRPLKMSDSRKAGFPMQRRTKNFAWLLARPRRARPLKPPKKQPQPAFFYPF
jgi:ASCH domain